MEEIQICCQNNEKQNSRYSMAATGEKILHNSKKYILKSH